MAIGDTPYNFTNTMSIQRNTTSLVDQMSERITEEINRSFQDNLLYGSSAVRVTTSPTTTNGITPYGVNIERLDPTGIHTGVGLESQIQESNRPPHQTTISEEDIWRSLSTTTYNTGTEWVAYTGASGYSYMANNILNYSNTHNVHTTIDRSGSKITHSNSEDYSIFSFKIIKEDHTIKASTNKGTKREYDLLMKNVERGIYINTKNIKWTYESR